MSDLTAALATSHEFRHKDKEYKVSLITQNVKADFQRKLFARAKEAAVMLKDAMDSREYQAHLKELNSDFIAGHYSLESQIGTEFIQSVPGSLMLSSMLFGVSEDEMAKLFLEAKEEITSLIQLIVKESFGIQGDNDAASV